MRATTSRTTSHATTGVTAVSPAEPSVTRRDSTPAEIVAQLDSEFFAEPPSSPWSSHATTKASKVLPALLPPGSSLGRIECRTTLCRIEATHANLDSFLNFTDAMGRNRETGLWNGTITAQVVGQTPGAVQAVTFVSKEGATIPFPESGQAEDR
jgi:hypothetical protein